MYYQFKKYMQFLFGSTNKHGVHSPFVFDLITHCFNKKTPQNTIKIWRNYYVELSKNNKVIKVTDYGAGSRVFKGNKRIVSDILKKVSIAKKEAALLTRIVSYFNIENILEIGTSLGLGTLALALGNKKAQISTLEGCPQTLAISKDKLQNYVTNNINFIEGEFSSTLPKVLVNKKFDLIYFDGNHQKDATIQYFEQCLQTIHNNSVFIFDDIYWSAAMTEAWEYIKNHQKVTLTIDTFHLGFVFFRKEQFQKEHFKIRM
jgi:predicted O-methyltransferase YrrM